MFEKGSAEFYQVWMLKKTQVFLTEVPVSACPVETLGITMLCRMNSIGLMPTEKQNSGKNGHQYWLLCSLENTAVLVPSRMENQLPTPYYWGREVSIGSAGEFQLLDALCVGLQHFAWGDCLDKEVKSCRGRNRSTHLAQSIIHCSN